MSRTEPIESTVVDARAGRDSGFSYIEIVVTIVLMGIVVLPILAAVRSSVRAASVSQAAAEVETVLINAADNVNQVATVGTWCDLTSSAKAAAPIQGWDPSTIDVEHQYLQSDGTWSPVVAPDASCPSSWLISPRTEPVLLIRITVSSPVENVTRTLEMVKSGV